MTQQTEVKQPKKCRNEIQDLPVQQQVLGLETDKQLINKEIQELAPRLIPLEQLQENGGNRGGVYDEARIEELARTLRVRKEEPIQVLDMNTGTYRIHDGNYR